VFSSLAVVSGDVEAVTTSQLVVESFSFGQYQLGVSSVSVQKDYFEGQVRPPLVHRVAAYLVCTQHAIIIIFITTTMPSSSPSSLSTTSSTTTISSVDFYIVSQKFTPFLFSL